MLRARGCAAALTDSRQLLAGPRPRGVTSRARRLPLAPVAASQQDGSSSKKGRQPWEIGRFLQTVLFFNKPPSPAEVVAAVTSQPLKLLQSVLSRDVENQKSAVLTVVAPTMASGPPRTAGDVVVRALLVNNSL
jgi:hypothetical protein